MYTTFACGFRLYIFHLLRQLLPLYHSKLKRHPIRPKQESSRQLPTAHLNALSSDIKHLLHFLIFIPPNNFSTLVKPLAKMSEVSFIKSFLNSLDSKPVKLPADYVIDPERVPLRAPVRPSPLISPSSTSNSKKGIAMPNS